MNQFIQDLVKIRPEPSINQLMRDLATPKRCLPGLAVIERIQDDASKLQQSSVSVSETYPEFFRQDAVEREFQRSVSQLVGVAELETLIRDVMAPAERIQREIDEILPITVLQFVQHLAPNLGIDFEPRFGSVGCHKNAGDSSQQVSKKAPREFVALEANGKHDSVASIGVVSSERQMALVQKIPPGLLSSMPSDATMLAFCVSFSLNAQLAKRLAAALERYGATLEAVFGSASRDIRKDLRKRGVDAENWDKVTKYLTLSQLRRAAQWVFREVTGAVPLSFKQVRFRRLFLDHRNNLSHGRNVALSQAEEMIEMTLEIVEALEDAELLIHSTKL